MFLQRVDDLVELVVVRVPVDGDGHGDADPGLAGQLDERGDSLDTVTRIYHFIFSADSSNISDSAPKIVGVFQELTFSPYSPWAATVLT